MDWKNDKEFLACVDDIIEHDLFKSTENIKQHGNNTTMEHSIRVSYRSYLQCKKKGLDYVAAARAGLLHDFFLYDWRQQKALGMSYGLHVFRHPRIAMKNAQEIFDVSNKESNMILRHMWPLTAIPPRCKEGRILSWADKYCSMKEVWSHLVSKSSKLIARIARGIAKVPTF